VFYFFSGTQAALFPTLICPYVSDYSYALAMEFQKRVVDSWRSHGPDARDELKEAIRLYNQIKTKALASQSPGGSANALPEPQEQETDSDPAKAVQQ